MHETAYFISDSGTQCFDGEHIHGFGSICSRHGFTVINNNILHVDSFPISSDILNLIYEIKELNEMKCNETKRNETK